METALKSIWPIEMPTRLALPAASTLPFAPTWIVTVVAELDENRAMPLNFELSRMRTSSAVSCATSAVILAWSDVDSVPLANWIDSSRTRCRIECISLSEPSAVWTSEMPSCALRLACAVPRIWARMPSEIARPAASSAARLMRRPRGELLHRLRHPDRGLGQVAVGVERLHVGIDPKRHEILLDPGGCIRRSS